MELNPNHCEKGEETVNGTTIGLDLAKHVHVVGCDRHGKMVKRAAAGAGEDVLCEPARVRGGDGGIECTLLGAELGELGHEVRLVPHVKAYVRGNKNDYNDARAIAEAADMPEDGGAAGRAGVASDACVAERTALCNQTRGLLAEYGVVVAQGVGALRRRLPELLEDAENGLSDEQMCERHRASRPPNRASKTSR